MEYLRQCWYMAAWADEVVPRQPFARTLLEQPVLLYRDAAGIARAAGYAPGTYAFRAASVRANRLVTSRSRLATVKTRIVRNTRARATLRAHLNYLRREGVTHAANKLQHRHMITAVCAECRGKGSCGRFPRNRHVR